MPDPQLRKALLRALRQELAVFSFMNLLDPDVAEEYEVGRRQLCEGVPSKFMQRVKRFLDIRIV